MTANSARRSAKVTDHRTPSWLGPLSRRLPGTGRAPLAGRLTLIGIVALASVGCTTTGTNPSAGPQSPAAAVPTEPAKAPATFQVTPAPAIVAADCGPGDVAAKVLGFGPAMGTMYIAVGLTPTHGSCSLPAAPSATAVDAAGSKATVGAAPDVAAGSRVAVTSQGITFRIAVYSWCDSSKLSSIDLVLDPGNGLEVSAPLPADFAVACTGSVTSLALGQPVEP